MTLQHFEKKANRLHLAVADMFRAQRFVRDLYDMQCSSAVPVENRHGLFEAVLIGAITVYARPFTNSYSQGFADSKVDVVEIDLFENEPIHKQMHESLITYRNKAVAHGDWAYFKVDPTEYFENGTRGRRHHEPDLLKAIDLKTFTALTVFVAGKLHKAAVEADNSIAALRSSESSI